MMQRKSTPSVQLNRLLMVLLGSTMLGVSAVAVSQTEPEPAPSVSEPIAAEPMATEPTSAEPEPAEPAPTGEPATAQPEPIAPPYNVNPNVVQSAPPVTAPAPEAITVTVQYNEGDYQRVFEDMDANRNGVIGSSELRQGVLPNDVIARISHERQMSRTDGRNEGGYESPATPGLR
jgi:hypothetical protein